MKNETPTKRTIWFLIVAVMLSAWLLHCNDSSGPDLNPPSSLSYSSDTVTFFVDAAVIDSPTVTGAVTRFSVDPALPRGLVLDTLTGRIAGIPDTSAATGNYTVTATNEAGFTTVNLRITVEIPAPPSNLSYATPVSYDQGIAITANVPTVTGVVSHFSIEPVLPSGLAFDSLTGVISGTPLSFSAATNYVVTASNIGGSDTATVRIDVFLGTLWTSRTSGTSGNLFSVASTGTQLVAVGLNGTILTSPDGATWTSRTSTSGTTNTLNSVTWTGNKLVAVGFSGTIDTSTNGVNWSALSSVVTTTLNSVVWAGSPIGTAGYLVSVGDAGLIRTSPTGVAWTTRTSGTTINLRSVTWTGSGSRQLVAVGANGVILTSADTGKTWTPRTSSISGTTNELRSVVWTGPSTGSGAGQLVAVGGNASTGTSGIILTSADTGKTWTVRTDTAANYLSSVTWTGNNLVAVGNQFTAGSATGKAIILISPDGVTWTNQTTSVLSNVPSSNSLTSVVWTGASPAFGAGQLVTVGYNGTILTSP